jgi:hypothetical protein
VRIEGMMVVVMMMMMMKVTLFVNNALGVSECSVQWWHDQ